MGCRSALYVNNPNTQTLTIGSQISVGSVVRRFGCNVNLVGTTIQLKGSGYYDVKSNFAIEGTSTGTVTISLLQDGMPVNGANTTLGVVDGTISTLPMDVVVRVVEPDVISNLTFEIYGVGADVTNVTSVIEKI